MYVVSVKENSRHLRKNMTNAERRLWLHLRCEQRGCKFRRQAPIGPYIADFVSFTHKLIIELDGGHHAEADQLAYDRLRQQHLEGEGFRVLRFWNHQVMGEMESVLGVVDAAIIGR